MEWYVQSGGQQHGPFSLEQMRANYRPDLVVWKQGMPGWLQAAQVPELAPQAQPQPPAAAPASFPRPGGPPASFQAPAAAPVGFQPPGMTPGMAMQPGGFGQRPAAAGPGVFAGIENAAASQDGNYIRPGTYVVQVVRLKLGASQLKGTFFAVEMRIVGVIDDGRMDPGGQPGHRVGEDVTHMMMAVHASFRNNVKAAVCGILGVPEEQVTEAVCNQVCADNQPCANTFMEVYAHTIRTRPKPGMPQGSPFTKVVYRTRVPAASVKAALIGADPSGNTEARLFPNGLLDQIVTYERSIGISPQLTQMGQPTAPGFGAPAQPQPQAAPQAAPAQMPWVPGAPPAQPAPAAFPHQAAPQAAPPFMPGPAPGAVPAAFPGGAPPNPGGFFPR